MAQLTDIIRKNIELLTGYDREYKQLPRMEGQSLPNMTRLKEIISILKDIFFPGFFSEAGANTSMHYYLGLQMENLYPLLREQIRKGLHFFSDQAPDMPDADDAEALSLAFLGKIPEIKRLLCTDVLAMFDNDPAAWGSDYLLPQYTGHDPLPGCPRTVAAGYPRAAAYHHGTGSLGYRDRHPSGRTDWRIFQYRPRHGRGHRLVRDHRQSCEPL